MVEKFREKRSVVEAVQWNGDNIDEIKNLVHRCFDSFGSIEVESESTLLIKTKNSIFEVRKNMYVIKYSDGKLCSCTQDYFNNKFEKVLEHKYETTLRFYKELQDRNDARRYYFSMFGLYERLAKGGIECSMTLDDKNSICTIYCYGVELADNSERINKSFEDVLEEEENDQ